MHQSHVLQAVLPIIAGPRTQTYSNFNCPIVITLSRTHVLSLLLFIRHVIRTHVPLIFLNRDKKSYWLSEKSATLHKEPFCNRNVHTCTFLLQNGALWDVHISANGALWDICLMHSGICKMSLKCPGAGIVTLKDVGKINWNQPIIKHLIHRVFSAHNS